METPELRALNRALNSLRKAGIDVRVSHFYNATGFDYIILLPQTVYMNGHGFELLPPVEGKGKQNDA